MAAERARQRRLPDLAGAEERGGGLRSQGRTKPSFHETRQHRHGISGIDSRFARMRHFGGSEPEVRIPLDLRDADLDELAEPRTNLFPSGAAEDRPSVTQRREPHTDSLGRTTTFSFKFFRRRSYVTHPDGSSERFVFDRSGNVIRHETARGIIRRFEFEPGTRNRLDRRECGWRGCADSDSSTPHRVGLPVAVNLDSFRRGTACRVNPPVAFFEGRRSKSIAPCREA